MGKILVFFFLNNGHGKKWQAVMPVKITCQWVATMMLRFFLIGGHALGSLVIGPQWLHAAYRWPTVSGENGSI